MFNRGNVLPSQQFITRTLTTNAVPDETRIDIFVFPK